MYPPAACLFDLFTPAACLLTRAWVTPAPADVAVVLPRALFPLLGRAALGEPRQRARVPTYRSMHNG